MRYQLTITGELDTPVTEDVIRADAHLFLPHVSSAHPGIVPGSVQLVGVDRLPDPVPVEVPDMTAEESADVAAFLAWRREREASRTA